MELINNMIKRIRKILPVPTNSQRGVVLPIILMAIGGLSLIGAAAISVTTGEIGIANNDKMYKAALNLAEAGISDANDGIQGNRDLVPRPIGAIPSASYTFNTQLASGRYQVSVELPVVTSISSPGALTGASSVPVVSTNNLGPGDTVIIGNTSIHMLAKISSINGTTLNLIDSRGQPYKLQYDATPDMFVSKNIIRLTSTGQSGTGLTGGAPTAWRFAFASLSPNTTFPAGGIVRSTATIQAEYAMQEIDIMDSFSATPNPPPQGGGKFNGPILVTNSLNVTQYNRGDYSGPIFISGNATANITPVGGSQITLPSTNPIVPKAIKIPAISLNAAVLTAQAAANATCYQKQCSNASATQQIYYLNGYQVDVKVFRPSQNGNGLQLNIGDDATVDASGNITFSFKITQNMNLGSSDNVTIAMANPGPPTNTSPTLNVASAPVITNAGGGDTGSITKTGNNLKFSSGTYSSGTIITVTIDPTGMPTSGTYVWLYDNSSNMPGFGGGKGWSNGVFMTPLGNIESQEREGDTNTYADGSAGSHTNHSAIVASNPPNQARGTYNPNNNTIATSTTWVNGRAVLFGGRLANSNQWVVGDRAEFWATYFIHTNASGSCNDHDIKITSLTKVTYLGISTKCNDSDQKKVFLYETIWNHTGTNGANKLFGTNSVQVDDSDVQSPHKGYYKWTRGKDSADSDPINPENLLGDKEFVSVFNHSTNPAFRSAVVNVNIERIRMVGWANPPVAFSSNTMNIAPSPLASTTWSMPANSSSWDWTDMVGNRSAFLSSGAANGFDFSGFTIAAKNVVPYVQGNDAVLPDMSPAPANNYFYLFKATSLPAELGSPNTWAATFPSTNPMQGGGTPIMDSTQLPTTTITATISGPYFTQFEIKRGTANLFFDAANGIPFNIYSLKIETKGAGANITIGSSTNPATVYAGSFKLESEDCGGTINFNFTGKMVSKNVEFEKNVKYNIDTIPTNAAGCLSSAQGFIYLKKQSWREIRN